MDGRVRELALLNRGIDSKLRGCDLVALKVQDVCDGDQVATRAIVMRRETPRPVQLSSRRQPGTLAKPGSGVRGVNRRSFLFPSRLHDR